MGDGAFQMLGVNTLIDVAKYHESWPNRTFVVLVLNNHDLNQVTWEQRVLAGDPKVQVSQVLPRLPLRRVRGVAGAARASASPRATRSRTPGSGR